MSYQQWGNKQQNNNYGNRPAQNNNQGTNQNNYGNQGSYNRQGANNQPQNNQGGGQKKQAVGGVWVRTAKTGKEFFSIIIDGKKYIAFPNEYKTEDKHPAFKIYEAEDNQQQRTYAKSQTPSQPQAQSQPQYQQPKQQYQQPQNNGWQGGYSVPAQTQAPVQQQHETVQEPPVQQVPVQNNMVTNEEFDDIPSF